MDFQWMEEIHWLRRLKSAVDIRRRIGAIAGFAPKIGLVPKPTARPWGISAMMRLKNESLTVEAAIRSLAPFVEQFSIVDNGSTDGTPDIVRRVADELGLDYAMKVLPEADFADVCDEALAGTTQQWVLRWDGDMVARETGSESFGTIRDYVLSLDPSRYWSVYFPHINIEGDLFHQDPSHLIHYEDYLFTFSPDLFHRRNGRLREMVYPLYYTRRHIWNTASFHLASLDDPVTLLQRSYWEEWRKQNDSSALTLERYTAQRIQDDYGTASLDRAAALHVSERFKHLVPYDRDRFGPYPAQMERLMQAYPYHIVHENGHIIGRSDMAEMAQYVSASENAADHESCSRATTVDIILPTRNRAEMAHNTAVALLGQDYPVFRVIVIDQSDDPSSDLEKLASTDSRLVYRHVPARGLPAARNEGLSLSGADIVIFVDDDVIPGPGFIDGHIAAYNDGTVGGTGGRIQETDIRRREPIDPHLTGRINFVTGTIRGGYDHDQSVELDTVRGANMSFRRGVLEKIGGFDSRFGGTFLFEETDVCLGIRHAGYRLRYVPGAVLTHLAADTGGCRIDNTATNVYWYGHNMTLLYCKHFPKRWLPLWLSVRLAKYARDGLRTWSAAPVIAGIRGMRDGYRTYRSSSGMRPGNSP